MQAITQSAPRGASYDTITIPPAVVIADLTVTDPSVVTESLHWSTGRRDVAVRVPEMAGADLSAFVTQALVVGAHAITSAGGTQDTFDLERLVTEVGTRTTEASSRAAAATSESVTQAAEAMKQMSEDTRRVIAEAGVSARKAFGENVDTATKAVLTDIQRIFGGENPELVARLTPILEAFGHQLDARTARQADELLAKAVRQFDPADPTSPMAKHAAAFQVQQASLTAILEKQHLAVVAKVDELATAVNVSTSAREAAAMLAKVTPLKGATYADGIHHVMREIAGGLGDEYADTGSVAGAIPRSKKGDGVLVVNGGAARLVLEMTDSTRTVWNEYLGEAERNRNAASSLGLVREPAQNGGHTIRCLGSRRIVMAFDPAIDDPQLLRTVVQLLRVAAMSASSRQDLAEIQTAEEKITEAITMLTTIDDVQKVASSIRKSADKVEGQCTSLHTGLTRLLIQARNALAGLDRAPTDAIVQPHQGSDSAA